jgi:hypothetical protein
MTVDTGRDSESIEQHEAGLVDQAKGATVVAREGAVKECDRVSRS